MEVLDKVRQEIARHNMIEPGQLIVVGVSGGPDSVALLHILHTLAGELGIKLHAAHLNHRFRGEEARQDALFVRQLCSNWGIPCTIEERDVPGYARQKHLSAQVAAREVRYRFFYEVLQAAGGQKIALAHQADDQAESVLLNLLRGAGAGGLAGIPPVRDNLIIRPLLSLRRQEIEQYCHRQRIGFRTDSSNLKTAYRRNKIRHVLIPLLEREYSPGLVNILVRTAEQLRTEDEFMEHLAEQAYRQVLLTRNSRRLELARGELARQPVALARRIIRLAWQEIRGSKQDLTYDHVERLLAQLPGGGPQRHWELPAGITVRLTYDRLTLLKEYGRNSLNLPVYPLPVPGSVATASGSTITSLLLRRQDFTGNPRELPAHQAVLDYAQVTLPLAVRFRQEGDVLVPFGLGKPVKLKKILIDLKIPRHRRDSIPLVVEQKTGRILWVAGIRLADGVGISETTEKIILLRLENGHHSNT
ncbi:tRNA lysidine(34) synthetase TilS [Desulforamulus hydrothermalis]|uniref:tRNA(Ile)-lysidine synthase n=1 Tax=Desulforamulus hydrothermalis Lam5 = DSM 18033 TaxID=1121428 RepID=K8DZR8_9FIRM|nr:tRNA lysidine(34) synthetase TilS [Desulforamulus hydrothermalis]CCO08637.1 tRNA(Ile)-lysidine synthase [Desulforamulus hydrothermalis Lam5 = DSM 18033]SHH00580.1 tRNA(Ile)-lysidine synthase [Desulforamulus hydrothermalis Lam5 = DSM 18033]